MSYAINDTNSIGIAIYGNGGMNSDYPGTSTSLFGAGPYGPFAMPNPVTGQPMGGGNGGVNLKQMFIAPTYAHKFMDGKLSVGATILFARQTISVKGLQAFRPFSVDPGNLSDNDYSMSTGWGGKVGVLYHATDKIALAGSYQTKMSMSEFGGYTGLFAEGGDFDIPSTWTVGGAFQVAPTWTLTADFQRINYSDVNSIGATSTTLGSPQHPLGADSGPGFGYSNVNVVKIGAQWQATPALQLRVGFNHGTNPVHSEDVVFNVLAPAVMKNHYTVGFTYALDQHQEISGAFMYAPEVTVTGANNFVAGYDPSTTTTIHMKQYEATIGYAYKF
jgi:long-chain fatty acid transport protein